jgi:hypothetical protein
MQEMPPQVKRSAEPLEEHSQERTCQNSRNLQSRGLEAALMP